MPNINKLSINQENVIRTISLPPTTITQREAILSVYKFESRKCLRYLYKIVRLRKNCSSINFFFNQIKVT